MAIATITDLDDPRLDSYRSLKQTNLTRGSGKFVAEGPRVVLRLLASSYRVESVILSERRVDTLTPQIGDRENVYVVPDSLAEQLVGFNFHAGALACGFRQTAPQLDEILSAEMERALLIVCPKITDPNNLGTLIRLGAAFGACGLLLGPGSADAFSRRSLRVSMGTAFQLPIVECQNLEGDLEMLRERWGIQLAATVLDRDAERLSQAVKPRRIALLFGNESDGLEPQWVSRCDRRLTIPMQGGTDSLNVSVAAGIFLHHFAQTSHDQTDTD